jgi:hypothetical protein
MLVRFEVSTVVGADYGQLGWQRTDSWVLTNQPEDIVYGDMVAASTTSNGLCTTH